MSIQDGDEAGESVLRGGLIVDGGGGEPYRSDVVLRGPRIAAIGSDVGEGSATEIDVSGLVIAPGFVDVHSHADTLPFLQGRNEELRRGAVLQGVTTVIVGNCGFSLFPVFGDDRGEEVRQHLATMFGQEVRVFADLEGCAAGWRAGGLDTNFAALVGHGTIRATVLGFENRAPTSPELDRMLALVRGALDQGALGVSTGLVYPPGAYAKTDELVRLASAVSPYGGTYVTHMRNETGGVTEALQEANEVARRASVPVEISHLKVAGKRNHGKLPYLLQMIDAVVEDGLEITADAYPYERGSTVLHALLPPWATEGGIQATVERMADPDIRRRVRADFAEPPSGWQNFIEGGSWDDVTLATVPGARELEGRHVGEVAAGRGQDPVDLIADLIASEQGSVTVTVDMMAEEDVTSCLASPQVMVGSDGIPIPGRPHPRWAGSFARMLSRSGRNRFGLTLAEIVHKMSAKPARRFGLPGSGVVEVGKRADLVVFDEEQVSDNATYEQPLQPPSGIQHVFVGGHHVVRNGVDGGLRVGRFLSRSAEQT